MELTKTDLEIAEELEQREKDRLALGDKTDLEYSKRHEKAVYKILKYNPIDPLNNLYRWILNQFNFLEKEGKLQWWAAYIYVKEICRRFWDFKVENLSGDLFPEYGAGIVVGNHESHIDPFFFGAACHRRIQYMSKDDNFKTPIVKTLFKNLGAFSLGIKGDERSVQLAFEKARKIIRGGEWVGLFPEGTRTMDGTLGEFRTGAVRLALETGVPIVPMAVLGSRDALPKGKLVMKPAHITVRVGKPIYYDDYDINKVSYSDIKKLTAELRQDIVDLLEGTYGEEKDKKTEELSIGSPEEAEKKSKFGGILKTLKKFGKGFLHLWDDSWYALLRALEVFDLKEHFQEIIYHLSGNLVHTFSNTMSPYRVIDYEKYIPKEAGGLVCSNHNSEWDVIILATSFQQRGLKLHQQAKESLFKIPVVNSWVRSCYAFPLKRGGHDVGSYNFARNLLENGKWVVVYPEGTTNQGGGELLEGHTGPIRLAIDAKVPIYLVGITGTEYVYPKHAKMLNFGKGIVLKAGEPFMEHTKYWDAGMPSYDVLKDLTNQMMERIRGLLLYNIPTLSE